MNNKTCGECRYMLHKDTFEVCTHSMTDTSMFDKACKHFAPPTNGDRIRQMSNKEFRDWYCEQIGMAVALMVDSMDAQYRYNVLAWLNDPADYCVNGFVCDRQDRKRGGQ